MSKTVQKLLEEHGLSEVGRQRLVPKKGRHLEYERIDESNKADLVRHLSKVIAKYGPCAVQIRV